MLRDKAEKLFQKLKNPVDLFGGINMTWLRVCVFAVAIIALLLFSIQRKMSTRLLSAGTTALLVAGAVIVAKIANLSI